MGRIIMDFSHKHRFVINFIIIVFFLGLYYSASIINHENFRTTAYDLGIYTNQMHHYLNFDAGNTVIYPNMKIKWADHFSLFQMVFAPFTYLLGSYTLLLAQIVMVILGGFGMKKIIFKLTENQLISSIGMIHFFSFWSIFSALSFDYHDNVIGAMIVPWFIYCFLNNRKTATLFLLFCVLLCKETMGLWMIFISLMMLFFSNEKSGRKLAMICLVISSIYFLAVYFLIMPNLDSSFVYKHFKYTFFGESFSDLIIYFLKHPLQSFKYLFVNHLDNKDYDGIKLSFWLVVLFSGGFVFLRHPKFIIGLIPIILLKMFNDKHTKWGLNLHYSIEIVPVVVFAFYYFVSKIKSFNKTQIAFIGMILCVFTSFKVISRDTKFYNVSRFNIFDNRHYKPIVDNENLKNLLNEFDDKNLKISATSALVTRLALRDHIYTFPNIGDADFIIINTKLMTWPVPNNKLEEELSVLNNSMEWELLKQVDDTYVYKLVSDRNTLNRVQFYTFY